MSKLFQPLQYFAKSQNIYNCRSAAYRVAPLELFEILHRAEGETELRAGDEPEVWVGDK